jgi:phosphatidylglycerol:prolipoprotein diacylglycerol transferase
MHPVLATFSIGGTEVVLRAYSTFYTLAWVVAISLATVIAWRRGVSWWRALVTFAVALLVGIIGARLLDLTVNWGYYAEDRARIYDLGFRGFALYGGLVLAVITAALLVRAFRLDLWRLADGAVPALVVGIVLMRTGCFLNGCCFGTVTSLPWGVTFPTGSPTWAHQLVTGQTGLLGLGGGVKPVHPTQLYEMIAAVALGCLAVWLLRQHSAAGAFPAQGGSDEPSAPGAASRTAPPASRTPSGVPFLVFALGFTLFRLGDHFLRARLVSISTPVWFYPLLYSLMCVGVAALMVWRLRSAREPVSESKGGDADDRR